MGKNLKQILDKLKQSMINEIMFGEEPVFEIMLVLKAVMLILGENETWYAAQNCMSKSDFLERLNKIDYSDVSKA
jgi:hypothetical protein